MRYNTQKRARKNGDKRIPDGFRAGYYNLKPDHMAEVRAHLMQELGWKSTTFYWKMGGYSAYSMEAIKEVLMAFRAYGLHAFTGAKIFTDTTDFVVSTTEGNIVVNTAEYETVKHE